MKELTQKKITMKTLNNIINKGILGAAVALSGLGAASCGDMLDLKPQGVLMAEQIGEEAALDLMTSAYSTLMNHYFGNNESFAGPINNWVIDLRSDDALKGGADVTMEDYMHQMEIGTIYSNNAIINDKWLNNYFSISRCNTAISSILASESLDNELKQSYVAEMKTLRAYYYFDMLRLFQKFPYIDETMVADEVPAGNYTREQVADAIRKDLKDSYEILPEIQDLPGRFNKYVAAAILARVDVFTATTIYGNSSSIWNEVEQYCGYIIGSGQYQLYKKFQYISLPDYNNMDESVFAVQFSSANQGAMYNFNNCLNCTWSEKNIYGNGDDFYLGSQDLANAFRTNDQGLPYINGVTSAYTGNDIVNRVDGIEAALPVYNGNVDPRLDLTLGRIGVYWRANPANNSQMYMYNEKWCRNYALYGQFSGKKPYPAPYNPAVEVGIVPWGASSLNYIIIRYADILLMQAEAIVEQGDAGRLGDAIALVNQVRQRAADSFDLNFVPLDFNASKVNYAVSPYPVTGWTVEAARQAVRAERRLEFAMEGLRWFDLLRWGTVQDVVTDYYRYESQFQPYYNGASLNSSSYYFPIPLAQVDNSNGLYKD